MCFHVLTVLRYPRLRRPLPRSVHPRPSAGFRDPPCRQTAPRAGSVGSRVRRRLLQRHLRAGRCVKRTCVFCSRVQTTLTLCESESLPRVFDRANGKQFDYVFNCGGETRLSQEETVFKLRSHALSLNIGREAAKRKIKCFVELSTGMVYKPDPKPSDEKGKLKPWTKLAKWKLQAEEDLAKIDGLNLVILRLAHVYGPYTSAWLGTQLCMARTYKDLGQEMKWLWDKDLRTNTVHVDDVVSAMWTAVGWYAKGAPKRPPPTFNIVDKGNTCLFTLNYRSLITANV